MTQQQMFCHHDKDVRGIVVSKTILLKSLRMEECLCFFISSSGVFLF
jgi:hypothetical protein